jgi:VCBS repeat protein
MVRNNLQRLWVILTIAAMGTAMPAAANHVQTESGRVIAFDHVTGNEWWVEVALSGPDAGSVAGVEAQDANGPWVPLQKKSWGPWAATFHIEPNNQVRFRANWAGGAQVVSCWFTHPAGVEQCAPSPWRTTVVGEAGPEARSGDLAISDVDNDGRPDVTVANDNGLRVFEWTGSSWAVEAVTSRPLHAVAAGDGDGDRLNEMYALSWNALYAYRRNTTGWDEQLLWTFPEANAGDMTLGNIDGAPGPELYLGLYNTTCEPDTHLCTSNSTVYRAWATETWNAAPVASLAGHIDSLWIGDGDRDVAAELYVGHGTRHADRTTQVRFTKASWQATGLPGTGSDSGMALAVAGDGNRDGTGEVYVANWYGNLRKLTYDGTAGWTAEILFDEMRTPDGNVVNPNSLFLGDADGDGSQELYLATASGDLVQVRWSGTAWQLARIADPTDAGRVPTTGMLVVGDGDGDGHREAYLSVSFRDEDFVDPAVTRIYKVDVPGTTAFDATFSSVRGNEWWIQANVAATGGTLSKVDVRLSGGAWQPLAKQSWGGWAASYHATQGTLVQLRATSTTGQTDLSECYAWIPQPDRDAMKASCGSTTQPFDADFTGVKGNEWWVQVNVAANEKLSGVDARVNCGSWVALDFYSWGGWAKSFHVPNGAKVDFRARSQTGATDVSGGYVWPQATPTSGC